MVTSFPVVMFGKTYCGYCRRAKELLTQLGAIYNVIELDEESNGEEIQSALAQWTGQRTAPNVFIGGNNVGGSLIQRNQEGTLVPLLAGAGAIAKTKCEYSSYSKLMYMR